MTRRRTERAPDDFMHDTPFSDPALTVALALAAGIIAQSLARHLRVPGIVLLLGAGVLLGPDLLDIVRPGTLGLGLRTLVGFAVAVILFEGGMNLNLRRLGHEARSIRQLVTIGALVTAVGGMLCARLILGWSWTPSILFGTLVIVTGPTVITPCCDASESIATWRPFWRRRVCWSMPSAPSRRSSRSRC